MKRYLYLLLAIMAMSTVTFAMISAPVRAQATIPPSGTYVNFFVNQPAGFIAGKDPVGEYIYRDVDQGTGRTNFVSAGDIRVTPVGSYAAGSVVIVGDTDIGKSLVVFRTGATAPREKHTENLLNTLFDYGEHIYRDADGNSLVSDGDVRYTNVGTYTAGTKVSLLNGDTDIGTPLVNFLTTTPNFEKHQSNIIADAFYDYAKILVDIYVDTDLIDADAGSMAGWQINIQVNPSVITPTAESIGAVAGYFLKDFCTNQFLTESPSLVSAVQPDVLKLAEQIVPTPAIGAGNATFEPGGYKLVTAVFAAQSATAYSNIDLQFIDTLVGGDPNNPGNDGISDDWMTTEGFWWPATVFDGNYNPPAVPEFPLGLAPIALLAPLAPLIYLWRTRRKVIKK